MSTEEQPRTMRAVSVVAIGAHLAAIALYLTGAVVASGPGIDPLWPLPIAAIYAAPAVIAIAGLRGRGTLLLAAAIAAGALAVFPFSLHSFVLAPAAVVYAIAYARVAAPESLRRAKLSVVGFPLLLMAAFLALIIQDHPACYEELENGEVTIDRDPGPAALGSAMIEADSEVVRAGCTSDMIVWWEAAASLALSGTAVTVALLSAPTSRARRRGVSTDAE